MQVINQELWQKCQDNNPEGYGKAIHDFAVRWADLMETAIGQGKTVAEVAKQTSHDADTEGITGFMYGAAVSTLAAVWKYGEELRIWHNLDIQIGTEGEKANASGGVLNPALLNIKF